MQHVIEGKGVGVLLKEHPDFRDLLLDFFTWRNDPSSFEWKKQSAVWQQVMRMLSFLVWSAEMQAPRMALGGSGTAPPESPKPSGGAAQSTVG